MQYEIVERNDALRTARVVGRTSVWADAVAALQARFGPGGTDSMRSFFAVEIRTAADGAVVHLARGTADAGPFVRRALDAQLPVKELSR